MDYLLTSDIWSIKKSVKHRGLWEYRIQPSEQCTAPAFPWLISRLPVSLLLYSLDLPNQLVKRFVYVAA